MVTATDAAGNSTATTDSSNAEVDIIPPVITVGNITVGGASGTNGAFKIGDRVTATWDSTAAGDNNADIASASFDFSQFGGGNNVAATNTAGRWAASFTITSGSIDQVNRNVRLTVTDRAGNQTTLLDDDNVTLDNIAPTVTSAHISVSGASGAPNNSIFISGDTVVVVWNDTATGNNNTDTISNVTVDFSAIGGGASVAATNAAGQWTATYQLAAGAFTGSNFSVAITAIDNAGNVTTVTDDDTLVVDTQAPPVPSAPVLADASNSGSLMDMITNDDTPTINGTAEANTSITIFSGGAAVGTTSVDANQDWTFTFSTSLSNGDHVITAVAADAAGNKSAVSMALTITIDTEAPAPPAAPLLDVASNSGRSDDTITNIITPIIAGTVVAGITVEVYVGGVSQGTAAVDNNGDWSYTLVSGSLVEGENSITVTAVDESENTSLHSAPLLLTIDTIAPPQPASATLHSASNSGVPTDMVTSDTRPTINGFVQMASDVEVFADGVSQGIVQVSGESSWSFTFLDDLIEGENLITIKAFDIAGNSSALSDPLIITVDTAGPVIRINDPVMGDNLIAMSEVTAVTIEGTTIAAEDGQFVTVNVSDGTTITTVSATVTNNEWRSTVDLGALSEGALTITADVSDLAGNIAQQASHEIIKDTENPVVTITGPTRTVTSSFDVIIEFSKNIYGFEISDVAVVNGTALNLTGSGAKFSVQIEPMLGKVVQVSVAQGVVTSAAGNLNKASNVFEIQAGSVATEFNKHRDDIRQVLTDDAARSLRSLLDTNQRMVRAARSRLISRHTNKSNCSENAGASSGGTTPCGSALGQLGAVPFGVDGSLTLTSNSISTLGSFFQKSKGVKDRFFFGDFDVQFNSTTASTAAVLNARVVWETNKLDETVLGYFVGSRIEDAAVSGAFEGDNIKLGLDAGAYAVHRLGPFLYLDGFASVSAGRNDLNMSNDVLQLRSDYNDKALSIGASMGGRIEKSGYELRPEFAVHYGRTWIGRVGFTGQAYGLTDDALRLDADAVTVGNTTLRTEIIVPLDRRTVTQSQARFTFTPRIICEYTKTIKQAQYCGGGAEFGLSSASSDGLSTADIKFIMDAIDGGKRFNLQIGVQHRF